MKVNNITYLPCTALLALLFASGLINAVPVPFRLAGSIAAPKTFHITGANQANLPVLTPALYKRTARGERLPFDDLKRYLSLDTALKELSELRSQEGDHLSKRGIRGGSRPYTDELKRDLSSTTILEEEVSEPQFENAVDLYKRAARGGRRPYDDMKRDLTSTTAH